MLADHFPSLLLLQNGMSQLNGAKTLKMLMPSSAANPLVQTNRHRRLMLTLGPMEQVTPAKVGRVQDGNLLKRPTSIYLHRA